MPLIWVTYFGEVDIAYWEWLLAVLYVVVIYMYFARRKNIMIKRAPEYRFYLWGLFAKLAGAVAFSLIYFYYYRGGDTISYFYSGVAMRNMATTHPMEYIREMLGSNTIDNWLSYPYDAARPYKYVFLDDRTFLVIRFISLLCFITLRSYVVTTILVASVTYFGVWAGYRTFVSYFPSLAGKLAIGFLFLPSVLFWGSSILKDTFTFSATCLWVHAVDEVFFKKCGLIGNWSAIVLSGLTLILIKPYIFMILLPATILWLLYYRLSRLKNKMVKFVLVPVLAAGLFGATIAALTGLSGQLGKFALDDALTTIQATQDDLLNNKSYGSNSFDIGLVDGTWQSVLSKFPQAVNAALFRPYIFEARSATMVISGLEDLLILGLAVFSIIRAGPVFFLRCIRSIPLLLLCFSFTLFFAFIVGITTPNFGAMVRFRIPMMPFFVSMLYIVVYLTQQKRNAAKQGRTFNLRSYRNGGSPEGVPHISMRDQRGK